MPKTKRAKSPIPIQETLDRLFGKNRSGHYLDEFANQVRFLHDVYNPDCVFLTETSGTPMGYLFKQAWKTAYPGEQPPKFYRIIPGRGSEEFFKKRIKEKHSKIFVYDEWSDSGRALHLVGEKLKNHGYSNVVLGDYNGRNLLGEHTDFIESTLTKKFIQEREDATNEEELNEAKRRFREGKSIGEWAKFGGGHRIADHLGKVTAKYLTRNKDEEVDTPEINSLSDLRTKAHKEVVGDVGVISGELSTIKTYKEVGKYVGEHILDEEQRVRGLEQKVTSVVAIAGFLGSLFFIGSNVTGNAIADLSTNTTSRVGGVLLVVGLVAGFFWIKNKKKNSNSKSKKRKN
jgi:hypothetical protein